MINNIYSRIKHFIKENYKVLIIFTIIYFGLQIRLPYSIYTPGGLININDRLSETNNSSSINLTYVSSLDGTMPMVLLSYILPSWDLVKDEDVVLDNETITNAYNREVLSLYESLSAAKYVAYNAANKELVINNKNIYVYYISEYAKTNLFIGDKLISIDNIKLKEMDDAISIVSKHQVGDIINIEVLRNNKSVISSAKVVDIDGEPRIGIVMKTTYDYENSIEYSFKDHESGPSGGLMITLAIYNALTKDDITKGKIISGTGTIDYEGNVGSIGGVKYKLAGAVKKNADVFIVPSDDNYKEALSLVKKYNYDIKLISATNFNQVLDELANLE